MKRVNVHASESELWLMAEGELRARRSAKLRVHIEGCWRCKTELALLQDTITSVMEYRSTYLFPGIPERPAARYRLASQLQELEMKFDQTKRRRPSLIARMRQRLLPGFLACSTAAAIALFAFWTIQAPVISATEIMTRAVAAEREETKMHQRVEIRSGWTSLAKDVWRDGHEHGDRTPLVRDDRGGRELGGLLVKVGWSDRDPLGAQTFAHWRNSLKSKRDFVRDSGRYLEVSTVTDEGAIAKAQLTIRRSDFHALSGTLQLRNRVAIQMDELLFDPAEPISVASAAVVPHDLASPSPRTKKLEKQPASLIIDPPNQDDVEAHVRFVLHQLQSDVGTPIEVGRRDLSGEVILDVSNATPEQADRVRQALPEIVIESAVPGSYDLPSTPAQVLPLQPGVSLDKIPALEEKVADPQRRTMIGNAAIEESHAALLRAYALRNLMQRYTGESMQRLSLQSQSEIAVIAKDHRDALQENLNRLDSRLDGIFPQCQSGSAIPAPGSANDLLSTVSELDLLTNVIFAGARTTLSADEATQRIACVVAEAKRSVERLADISNP